MAAEAMTAVGLVASSFAATNLDNLALLVGWLLMDRGRRRRVLAGHLLGMFSLLLIAFGFGLGANLFPVRYIGYLGLIPIGLGAKGLYDLIQARREEEHASVGADESLVGPLGIAATQVANGLDTVLVFGPLLADSEVGIDLVMVLGFTTMAFLWYGLASLLERQAARLSVLERASHWIAPIVLIAVGIYILDNTSTDVLPGG